MSWIVALASLRGRMAAIGLAVLALVSWRTYDVIHQRGIGEAKAVAKMEKASDANAKKADAARRSADDLPAERLRDKYFRD